MKNKKTHMVTRLTAVAAVVAAVLSPVAASAVTANTTINATVGATISMTTSTTVAIGVTPTAPGSMSSSSDAVSVSTNNALGFTLSLADTDATTTLVSGGNTFVADAGTQASPTASLTNNRWGYRVDSIGGFGAGATTTETNVASSAFSWAGVPATGSPNTIKTTATTASNNITTVWYGVKADTTKPNGVYTDSVTYTATTN
ncbi:hypothetical protein H7Y40_00650 [Pedobacter sp.]|nr:hypothetical protein [Candidatus Saccharibacteria bacterium]